MRKGQMLCLLLALLLGLAGPGGGIRMAACEDGLKRGVAQGAAEVDCGGFAVRLVDASVTREEAVLHIDVVFPDEEAARRHPMEVCSTLTREEAREMTPLTLCVEDENCRPFFGGPDGASVRVGEALPREDGTWVAAVRVISVAVEALSDVCQIVPVLCSASGAGHRPLWGRAITMRFE